MRNFLIIALMLILSNSLLSQNYSLVTGSTKNLYVLDIDQSTFSLVVDSVSDNSGVSRFYTQLTVSDSMNKVSQNCSFWGGAECISFSKHGLLGETIINESDSLWYLFNDYGDTLVFNTTLEVGQSRNILEFNNETFYVTCTSIQPEEFLGVIDTVKTYDIFYLDRFGIYRIYNSDLSFKISKNHGLICAFDMSIFPDYTEGFTIAGSEELQKGLYRIRSSDVYNFAVGDVFQYRNESFESIYPNPITTTEIQYERREILERQETADSVIYLIEKSWFTVGTSAQSSDTVRESYSKLDSVVSLPVEASSPHDMDMLSRKKLYRELYSNIGDGWTIIIDNDWSKRYCALDMCFGNADTQGQVITDRTISILGVGMFYSIFKTVYPLNNYSTVSYESTLCFYKKQNTIWGDEAFVGIDHFANLDNSISLYPNPVSDIVNIEGQQYGIYKIIDLSGAVVASGIKDADLVKVDISGLSKGIYMVRLQSGSSVSSARFVKIN